MGGPVWHASVAGTIPAILRSVALQQLEGVGDREHEWHEWTGRAYHIRRRLTAAEQEQTGPAVDCRGTAEWNRRYSDAAHKLPSVAKRMALEEAADRPG